MFRKQNTRIVCGLFIAIASMAFPILANVRATPPSVDNAQDDPSPDLQKQIDDALKELDKLEKIIPDQADGAKRQLDEIRNQMRRQGPGIGNGGLIIPPGLGGLGGIGGIGGIGGRAGLIGSGRWGVALQPPPAVLVDQLQLPPGQGLVVIDVRVDSPAAKAGVLKHDIVMEVDGKAASSDFGQFQRDVRDIKAGIDVNLSVIRQGKRETVKGMKLPEAKAEIVPPVNLPIVGAGVAPGGVIQINGAPGKALGNAGNVQVRVHATETEIMKSQVNGDEFTVDLVAIDMRAKVTGKRENGKATPADIVIQDGDARITACAMDQVPERYRMMVMRMMETIR